MFAGIAAQLVAVQQAPRGCGQATAAQVEPDPWKVPPHAVQSPLLSPAEHAPSGTQQAPTGHVPAELQATPVPMYEPPRLWHCSWVVLRQLPVEAQHAPMGWGQVTPGQVVPAPRKVEVPHWVAATTEHQPEALQHAPMVCGQGLGEQIEPSPWYVPVHVSCAVVVHDPDGAQQAPV